MYSPALRIDFDELDAKTVRFRLPRTTVGGSERGWRLDELRVSDILERQQQSASPAVQFTGTGSCRNCSRIAGSCSVIHSMTSA